MAKLLADMTKEELEILCREQGADLCILAETKRKVLEKNKQLVAQVVELTKDLQFVKSNMEYFMDRVEILENENYQLIKKMRDNGLL